MSGHQIFILTMLGMICTLFLLSDLINAWAKRGRGGCRCECEHRPQLQKNDRPPVS